MASARSSSGAGWRGYAGAAGLALLAILFALSGFAMALANVLADRNPEAALRFGLDHPVAVAKAVDLAVFGGGEVPPSDIIRNGARESISGQPINPRAVRLLGFAADAAGDRDKAVDLMALSQKLSRQDLATQMWLIEHAAATGDAAGALSQYDLALRTSAEAPEILFPVLADALSDRELWPAFTRHLRAAPDWIPHFLTYAIREGAHPDAIATLLLRTDGPDIGALETDLLGRLVVASRFDLARRYYLSLDGATQRTLRTADFAGHNSDGRFAPISWQLYPKAEVDVSFVGGKAEGRNALELEANVGFRGTVARKFLMLPPGRYQVAIAPSPTSRSEGSLRWQLLCATDLAVLGTGDSASRGAGFAVGDRCPAQYFDLIVDNVRATDSLDLVIDDIAIARADDRTQS